MMEQPAMKHLLLAAILLISVSSVLCDDDVETDEIPEVPPAVVDGQEVPAPENMKNMENVMSFSPPTLNDEESHSQRLPSTLLCDGCIGVSYQLALGLLNFHMKRGLKPEERAAESDILEAIENICHPKTFENYGIKAVRGVNTISGPGTDSADEPGMMAGGGRWPARLATMCGEFTGEKDEYDIYLEALKGGIEGVTNLLCRNEEEIILNSCGSKGKRDEL